MLRAAAVPVRRLAWPPADRHDPEALVLREWLVANGLGGYASGTIAGAITRRYHGVLIAALAAPLGRTVMLSHLAEQVRFHDGRRAEIGGRERTGETRDAHGAGYLVEFRLEGGLPVWRYDVDGAIIEKRLFLPHMQNTVHLLYELVSGADAVDLALRPSVNFRPQEAPVSEPLDSAYECRGLGPDQAIALPGSPLPALRMKLCAEEAAFTVNERRLDNVLYPVEESRGYQARGDLWSPGYFGLRLRRGQPAAFVASTESVETMNVLQPWAAFEAEKQRRQRLVAQADETAHDGTAAELVLAADQFIVTPAGRMEETTRAHAFGDDVRTVIAGYHWFTDWGRDTMVSLEGLTLVTGRHVEAGYILRTFGHYVRDGLIPNLFPEGQTEGLYHTADATLWFFHAVDRYVAWSGDRLTLALLYPTLKRIVAHHIGGTRFGIHVDERDGLLAQGADGYQLTWMDAKVDDWVVTPRRGKAVEINALWYNALRLMERWAAAERDPDEAAYRTRADRVRASFNDRFWFAEGAYLFDVVDTPDGHSDSKCRPNQVFAISLTHPVLARERWEPVMRVVGEQLLTPVGLRSLAPGDPDFKPRYFGNLRARDAAYHEGTVWAWLVGPFVDAWLKVYPDDLDGAERAVRGLTESLDALCAGTLAEIFDAEPPFTPRGCVAQAWSVAEVLRVMVELTSRRRGARLPTETVGAS